MTRYKTAVAAGVPLLALALLTGCSSSPSGTSSAPDGSAVDPASAECVQVSDKMMATIAKGQQPANAGMEPVKGAAVKHPDFNNAYLVAMQWNMPGVGEPTTGVWVTNNLDGSSGVLSVDSLASEFTNWGEASTTSMQLASTDQYVQVVKDCLNK